MAITVQLRIGSKVLKLWKMDGLIGANGVLALGGLLNFPFPISLINLHLIKNKLLTKSA